MKRFQVIRKVYHDGGFVYPGQFVDMPDDYPDEGDPNLKLAPAPSRCP